jgi:hypothetical protein
LTLDPVQVRLDCKSTSSTSSTSTSTGIHHTTQTPRLRNCFIPGEFLYACCDDLTVT